MTLPIADDRHVYLIAEAGVNHNGDPARALAMVDAAAAAGVDAIKFQTFIPEALASRHAAKADYQIRNRAAGDTQLDMLRRLQLDFASHRRLRDHCQTRGIAFLSSPFDLDSADFLLDELALPILKLGSGELTNGPLLWRIARSPAHLILSTGMATLDEIRQALGLLCLALRGQDPSHPDTFAAAFDNARLRARVSLLHCTTAYPCPPDQVNLLAMDTLAHAFDLPVGYSDHTTGSAVSLAAVARGARIIEKHFTLDRNLPGPDHAASLEPGELHELVNGVRTIEQALGTALKQPGNEELRNALVARKALVAARPIRAGEAFSPENLTGKRPANGISPMAYWQLLGQTSTRDYAADEPIRE